jgi:hypothetical protein
MEEEMKKNWNFIKECFIDKPYLTKEEQENFQNKMKKAIREKKLKRILNI